MNNLLINNTLFQSIWIFNGAIIALFLLFIISEITENGYLAFCSILTFLFLNYFWGNYNIFSILTLRNVIIYLTSGFLYSILRTIVKGKQLSKKEKESFRLKDHVIRWWLLFPFSAIGWIVGDLFTKLVSSIYNKVEKFYSYIFNL